MVVVAMDEESKFSMVVYGKKTWVSMMKMITLMPTMMKLLEIFLPHLLQALMIHITTY
jgi:hypothetical protein